MKFFSKYNAFNAVLFGSVFLLALVRTFIFKDDMMIIANVLGVLTFIFSLINGIVNMLDEIIKFEDEQLEYEKDYITIEDEDCESEDEDEDCKRWELWYNFHEKYFSKKMKIEDLRECLVSDCISEDNISVIINGCAIRNKMRIHRKIRRIFLYGYYFIVMLMLLYLFLASDLNPYLKEFSLGEWTLWSFVIILFEILLKDSISDAIASNQINKIEKIKEKNLKEILKKKKNKEVQTCG